MRSTAHWTPTAHDRYRAGMRSSVLLALVLCACKSAPPPIAPDAEIVVVAAEKQLSAGEYEAVRDGLKERDLREFPKSLQPRYELTLARAQFALDEKFDAFETLREFADRHPHSDLREQVVALIYEIGRDLSASDRGFLFFWSDRRGGRVCLVHLVTRYPDSAQLADALRLLGEMAFADQDYDESQERFRELLVRRPDSEWVPLARFRFAMSLVASLQGPEYDLDQMVHASKELQAFLEKPPENPDFVSQARDSLARVLEWQAERYVKIADFYHTIGNHPGELASLKRAAADELKGTKASVEAKARLAELQAKPATGVGP
jgi:outer membrane protein assembly factor BamD (BamD/ComL family)